MRSRDKKNLSRIADYFKYLVTSSCERGARRGDETKDDDDDDDDVGTYVSVRYVVGSREGGG